MIKLNLFKKNIFLLLSIVFVIVIGCDNQSEKANIGQIVFPKTTIDNNNFNIENYSGKNILINFWFPSCPPCIYELDILDDINKKYDSVGVIGVQVLGLDNKEDGKNMLEKKNISYKSVADESDAIIDLLQINVFPTTILFDKNGDEINRWIGIIDEQIVSNKISEIE
ncbi:MAG: TlpA family protein disulfide reductase [Dehalococcoidia bacterium]|nr:TlpA family protein disulfide reductase [Dehalococcoidia bacterium]|tara:strand:+ start:38 stop:541 length:504 start_codon:yes stop_codon:yes gene_type:complete